MKLEDTRQIYYDTTGKVSELVRQLGFAGIAIIWVFKTDNKLISRAFLPAAILIVLGLAADLFQYAASVVIWDKFNRNKEDELTEKAKALAGSGEVFDIEGEDFDAPANINDLTKMLFWIKFALMFAAYVCLIVYLMRLVFRAA